MTGRADEPIWASLVGMTEEEAREATAGEGHALRVVQRDGEDLPATMDYRTDRVNVAVQDGRVTSVHSIG